MNTQKLHPLDISIVSDPATVPTYKKYPLDGYFLKKFIFTCENSSYVINLLSLFLVNLKTKFYAIMFLVHLAQRFHLMSSGDECKKNHSHKKWKDLSVSCDHGGTCVFVQCNGFFCSSRPSADKSNSKYQTRTNLISY